MFATLFVVFRRALMVFAAFCFLHVFERSLSLIFCDSACPEVAKRLFFERLADLFVMR